MQLSCKLKSCRILRSLLRSPGPSTNHCAFLKDFKKKILYCTSVIAASAVKGVGRAGAAQHCLCWVLLSIWNCVASGSLLSWKDNRCCKNVSLACRRHCTKSVDYSGGDLCRIISCRICAQRSFSDGRHIGSWICHLFFVNSVWCDQLWAGWWWKQTNTQDLCTYSSRKSGYWSKKVVWVRPTRSIHGWGV